MRIISAPPLALCWESMACQQECCWVRGGYQSSSRRSPPSCACPGSLSVVEAGVFWAPSRTAHATELRFAITPRTYAKARERYHRIKQRLIPAVQVLIVAIVAEHNVYEPRVSEPCVRLAQKSLQNLITNHSQSDCALAHLINRMTHCLVIVAHVRRHVILMLNARQIVDDQYCKSAAY